MASDQTAEDIVRRIARVQALCETLTLPAMARGERHRVAFADGSAADMADVVREGREALSEVAGFFDVQAPTITGTEATRNAG